MSERMAYAIYLMAAMAFMACEDGTESSLGDATPSADATAADAGVMPALDMASTDAASLDAAPGDMAAPDAGDFPLELGGGEEQLTQLADGDEVLLHRGCQGAQHIWISLRAPTLEPALYPVTLAISHPDGAEAVPAHTIDYDFAAADPGAELIGVTLVVFDPLAVIGQPVDIHATVETGDGEVGRDTRRVTVEWGADDC